jgi:hypothetical protein
MIIEWLDVGPIDLEYKQYKLMSYLKDVDNDWDQYKLYPHLTNLVEYHGILNTISKNKKEIEDLFPKEMVGIDLEKREIIYEVNEYANQDITEELSEIIQWGLDTLLDYTQMGIVIYGEISEDIEVKKLGVGSPDEESGYIIFEGNELDLYQYNIGNILIDVNGNRFVYIEKVETLPKNRFESIYDVKFHLIQQTDKTTINCYVVKGHQPYPFNSTVLPIVRRKILNRNAPKQIL